MLEIEERMPVSGKFLKKQCNHRFQDSMIWYLCQIDPKAAKFLSLDINGTVTMSGEIQKCSQLISIEFNRTVSISK